MKDELLPPGENENTPPPAADQPSSAHSFTEGSDVPVNNDAVNFGANFAGTEHASGESAQLNGEPLPDLYEQMSREELIELIKKQHERIEDETGIRADLSAEIGGLREDLETAQNRPVAEEFPIPYRRGPIELLPLKDILRDFIKVSDRPQEELLYAKQMMSGL